MSTGLAIGCPPPSSEPPAPGSPPSRSASRADGVLPPPRGLSLRENFSWTFAGNVVYAASQWGLLVALAKLGSPEMVGRFSLGLAIAAPVMMLTNLQLRGVQATDARRQYRFGHYLALRLVMTTAALAVIAAISCLAGYSFEAAAVVVIVGVAKASESVSDVYHGLLQQN